MSWLTHPKLIGAAHFIPSKWANACCLISEIGLPGMYPPELSREPTPATRHSTKDCRDTLLAAKVSSFVVFFIFGEATALTVAGTSAFLTL